MGFSSRPHKKEHIGLSKFVGNLLLLVRKKDGYHHLVQDLKSNLKPCLFTSYECFSVSKARPLLMSILQTSLCRRSDTRRAKRDEFLIHSADVMRGYGLRNLILTNVMFTEPRSKNYHLSAADGQLVMHWNSKPSVYDKQQTGGRAAS